VQPAENIQIEDYDGLKDVTLHDGSVITLKKADKSHNPTDKIAAMQLLNEAQEQALFITGLLYVDSRRESLAELEGLTTPLSHLQQDKLRPSEASLQKIMKGMY
jgi:2-oxoglutarate ferredoxin oxidoreductase subunit beta